MPSERLSKKMELVLYLARKSTKMATYDELLDYFNTYLIRLNV